MSTNRYKGIVGGVLRALLMMAVIIPLADSCEYKPLVIDNTHQVTINIVYDWENAPYAYPEGMCIYFYNMEDGSYYDRWDFSATRADSHVMGGQIKLPVGTYSVITYNNDTEGVYFSGTDKFSTHTAFTAENTVYDGALGNTGGSPSSRTSSRTFADLDDFATDNTVYNNPSMMWGVTALDVVVTQESISYTTTRGTTGTTIVKSDETDMTLTLYPHELVATYTYDVINVHNVKYAYMVFGKLSGMASNLNLATAELGPEVYPVPFLASHTEGQSDDDGLISGSFYTFGNVGVENYMVFYAMLTNGDNWYTICDVSEQVQNAPDPMHVYILIDGMELPVAISNGDGFDPSVDDWQNVNHDINMGTN